MAKLTLNDIVNTYNVALINSNFTKIEDEFQNKVLYRDNPSGEPNSMASSIDMNGNRILNLPAPQSMNEPARLADVSGLGDITALVQQAEQAADSALVSEQAAQAYAGQAAASAAGAASAAISAQTFAEGLIGSSTTSSDYTLGTKVFVTQTGKQFNPGQFITITDATTPTSFMLAQVLSYSGANLTVDVQVANGTGTWAAWNISVSGVRGPQGATGATGPTGPAGSALTVKDEGVTLTTATTDMDFVGAGVTATNVGGVVTVTIPGATGTAITVKDEGTNLTTALASVDFVGAGVTATTVGNDVTVNIPGVNLTGTTSIGGATGSESLRVVQAPASSVNRVEITGNTTGNDPLIAANGTDTNVNLDIATKGTGVVSVSTNGGTEQFRVGHTASAVNYIQATGGATTAGPKLSAQGSDANIDLVLERKGTGSYNFNAPDSNALGFELGNNATGDRNVFLDFHADTTNTDFSYRLQRTGGANNGVVYNQAGTGAHTFTTSGSTANIQFGISHTASSVNYLNYTGGTTGVAPVAAATGTDTNISLDYRTKGTGGYDVKQAGGGTTYLFRVLGLSGTAANHVTVQSALTTIAPTIASAGTDANVDLRLNTKGIGNLVFAGGGNTLYTINGNTGALSGGTAGAAGIRITGSQYNLRLRDYTTAGLPSASTEGSGAIVRDSTTGELKMSNGSSWAAVGGSGASGLTLISSTAIPVGVTQIDYLNAFSSTYDDYEVYIDDLSAGGASTLQIRLAQGGSAITTSSYRVKDETSTTEVTSTATAATISPTFGGASNIGGTHILQFHSVNNTSVVSKRVMTRSSITTTTPGLNSSLKAVEFNNGSATAISGFQLIINGGGAVTVNQGGIIRVYGRAK